MKISFNLRLPLLVRFLEGKPCIITAMDIPAGQPNRNQGITITKFTFRKSGESIKSCNEYPYTHQIIIREPGDKGSFIKIFVDADAELDNEQLKRIAKQPHRFIRFDIMYNWLNGAKWNGRTYE